MFEATVSWQFYTVNVFSSKKFIFQVKSGFLAKIEKKNKKELHFSTANKIAVFCQPANQNPFAKISFIIFFNRYFVGLPRLFGLFCPWISALKMSLSRLFFDLESLTWIKQL